MSAPTAAGRQGGVARQVTLHVSHDSLLLIRSQVSRNESTHTGDGQDAGESLVSHGLAIRRKHVSTCDFRLYIGCVDTFIRD